MAASERYEGFDGWRGLAILTLLVGHFVPGFGGFGGSVRYGWGAGPLGVELFFVLSGCLMGGILLVKQQPLDVFYRRRVSRLFPALYAYLAAVAAATFAAGAVDRRSIASVVLLFFNYHILHVGVSNVSELYHHMWSLSMEEQCYMALSLVALASRRKLVRDGASIAVLTAASWAALAVYASRGIEWAYWRTEAHLGSVLIPAALSARLARGGRPLVRGAWVLAPFFAGLAFELAVMPDLVKYTLGTLCLAIAVTHLPYASAGVQRAFSMRWLATLGVLSYSIYLWQQPIYLLRGRLQGALQGWVRHASILALLDMGLAVGLGALSYYLLERPARRWLNEHWGRAPRAAPARTPAPAA